MKIVVLNGSPKGEISVTMQYVAYLQKLNPQCEFVFYPIAQQIQRIEREQAAFDEIIAAVRQADGVLWAFPLYFLLVHAHYKRFIELIFARGVQDAFAGKYAAALSTSIHFFDHTAHNYVHGICDDLGMRFVESFSPDMSDLFKAEGREALAAFGTHFFNAIEKRAPAQRQYAPLAVRDFTYRSGPLPAAAPSADKKVLILHDARPGSNLAQMVARCAASFSGPVTVFDLNDLKMSSSCLGCLRCGIANHCAFEGKDDFIDFYRSQVMTADILVYAGEIADRYLSWRWKAFFDRSFFNTHTPTLRGKQVAFVLSGPLSQVSNLRQILQGYGEVQMGNVVGFASDEYGQPADIDAVLDELMARALDYARSGYIRPATFLGVGGLKIFRDDVWGRLRTVFQADHRAYTRLGVYDTFPQRDIRSGLMNAVAIPLLKIPPLRRGFQREMTRQMIQPLKRVVEQAGQKE